MAELKDALKSETKLERLNAIHTFKKEIGEAVLKSGSYVSVDALVDLALWNIDTYIMTRRNRVVALLKNVEDDSHVETRLASIKQFLTKKNA